METQTASENRERIADLQAKEAKPVRNVPPISDAFRRSLDQHYRTNYQSNLRKYSSAAQNRHDAEDVINSAYLEACEYWNTINDLDSWMNTRLSNSFRAYLRDRINHGMTVSVELVNPEEIAEEQFTDDWHAVKDAVDRLSDEPAYRKQILTMYFAERKTAKEISEVTKFSPRSIETLVLRFRKELR